MKVEKIIIKKELMDIPNQPFYNFFKYKGIPVASYSSDLKDLPAYIDIETETWQVVRVFTPEKTVKKYLVKIDERGLFNELLEITNMFLKEKAMEAANVIVDIKVKNERRRISALPWWKRLLNRLD